MITTHTIIDRLIKSCEMFGWDGRNKKKTKEKYVQTIVHRVHFFSFFGNSYIDCKKCN